MLIDYIKNSVPYHQKRSGYATVYILSATPLGLFLVVSSSSVVAIIIDDAVTTDHPKTSCCYHYFYIQW